MLLMPGARRWDTSTDSHNAQSRGSHFIDVLIKGAFGDELKEEIKDWAAGRLAPSRRPRRVTFEEPSPKTVKACATVI